MIRRIQIRNFASLRDVTVDLSPLTIFIGPNASGKSAFFKALVMLSRLLSTAPVQGPRGEFHLEPGVTLDHLVWRGHSGLPIEFRVWWHDDPDHLPGYVLELRKEARGWSVTREKMKLGNVWFDSSEEVFEHDTERLGPKRWRAPYRATLSHLVRPFKNDQAASGKIGSFLELQQRYGETRRYRVSAAAIAAFASSSKDSEDVYVNETGWGLPLVLQRLQGENRPVFEKIERDLCTIFPHIRLINVQSERFGVGLAFSTNRSEDLVPGSQESDGVLITTFLLWRLHTGTPNLKVCVEEPENGLHPYLLAERYRLLRRFADGGRGPQLLVATHSPDFISTIEDQDEILNALRVCEFDPVQGTRIHALTRTAELETLLGAFQNNMGELWWSGAIGAIP